MSKFRSPTMCNVQWKRTFKRFGMNLEKIIKWKILTHCRRWNLWMVWKVDCCFAKGYYFSFLSVNVPDAVKNLQQYLGLGVCERSDKVPDGKASHALLLSGIYRGGVQVAARAKLALSADGAVNMNLSVRSTDATVTEIVASAVG